MILDELLAFFSLDPPVEEVRDGVLHVAGREVLDLLSQYGASPFGGTPPELAQDIRRFFAGPTPILCKPLSVSHAGHLKASLKTLCGMEGGAVLLTQSGAETVELAVKLARAATGKPQTIALPGAFHGKTNAAVQLTDNRGYAFGMDTDFVQRLPVGEFAMLESDFARITSGGRVNAAIVEVVQGEGGMIEIPVAWLVHLRELCRDAGVLFIVDEIQTGLGRTGAMLASTEVGLDPDVILLSKALGGGVVPIGACVVRPGLLPSDFTVFHSSTFADNNFTSFVAGRVLDLIERTLPMVQDAACALESSLKDLISRHGDVYSHVSGRGLMRGLHLRETHDDQSLVANFQWNSGLRSYAIAAWMLNHQNVLTMPCFSRPSCLRIQPPLTVRPAQIDQAVAAFEMLAALLRAPSADVVLFSGAKPVGVALPRRVIRPHVPAAGRRFQFTLHPPHEWSCLSHLPEGIDAYGEGARNRYLNRIQQLTGIFRGFGATSLNIPEFDLGGTRVHGRLNCINLTAAQMAGLNRRQRAALQRTFAESAETYDANVLGLGGFTSIITHPGFRRFGSKGVVTTGSSLTAYAAVEAALTEPALTTPAQFGVIGANGSIGGLCVQKLILAALQGERVGRIVLLSNPQNQNGRRDLAKSLRRWIRAWRKGAPDGHDPLTGWNALRAVAMAFENQGQSSDLVTVPDAFQTALADVLGHPLVQFATSLDIAVISQLDRILIATNSTDPSGDLGSLNACKPGAYLYDIGIPASVPADWVARAPVTVLFAGLMRAPGNLQFGHGNIAGLPRSVVLACLAETMLFTATDPLAAPSGPVIELEDTQRSGALARSVGLQPTLCPPPGVSPAPSPSIAG